MYIKINILPLKFYNLTESVFVGIKHTLKEDNGNNYNLFNMSNHYK